MNFVFHSVANKIRMSDYLKFAKQLGLAKSTEQSALFDIIGSLYDKFYNLNFGIPYESFLSEYFLNYIICIEAPIDDLVSPNDFVDVIQAEHTKCKREEKQTLFAKFEQYANEFIYNFPFQEGRVAVDNQV